MDNSNNEGKRLSKHEVALKSTFDGVKAYVQIRDAERKYAEKTIKGAKGKIGVQEVAEIKKSKDPEDMRKKRYNAAAKFHYNREKDSWDIKILGRKESIERQVKLLKELEESNLALESDRENIREVRELFENELKLREEKARVKADKKEQERLEQERLEAERLEAERKEQERLEAERLEAERLEQERLEQERLEQERLEAERLEAERKEQERKEQERLEQERKEQERLEQERLEQERLEQERLEQERLEQERLERLNIPPMPTMNDVLPIDRRDFIDQKQISKDYLYYKNLMIQSYYGNPKYAKLYDVAIRRLTSPSKLMDCSIEFDDPETGERKTVTYKGVADYPGYEADAKITQLEEYAMRLSRKNSYEAGYPYAYDNTPEGELLYQEDKKYLETYNQKYNSRKVTYENLKTLGNYGEKVPYSKFQEGETGKNIIRGVGNALKFVRNHTTAPINKFIGSKIVAPLYKRYAENKDDWEYPNPFENRATHRYEKRKEYFRNQGENFITSRLKAIFNYKEGNECTLAARGKELMDDIVRREAFHAGIRSEWHELETYNGLLAQYCTNLDARAKASLDPEEQQKCADAINAALDARWDTSDRQKQLEIQGGEGRDIINYDAIDDGTHNLRNKKNVTRVITGVKMFARAGIRFVGEKLSKWLVENSTKVVEHAPETEFVDGYYEQVPYTVKEFDGDDMPISVFLERKQGETVQVYRHTYGDAPSVPFEITEDTVIRGIKTNVYGRDSSVSDFPSSEFAENCIYNISPRFAEAIRQTTDFENLGLSKDDIGQLIVEGKQGDIYLAISNTKQGTPTGWLKVSQEELTEFFGDSVKEVTYHRDGDWIEGYNRVVKEGWTETVYNDRVINALNLTGKFTDAISDAQKLDMIYENARDLDDATSKRKVAFDNSRTIKKGPRRRSTLRRAYDFIENVEDLPVGHEDKRGFNYNPKTGEFEDSVVYDDDPER